MFGYELPGNSFQPCSIEFCCAQKSISAGVGALAGWFGVGGGLRAPVMLLQSCRLHRVTSYCSPVASLCFICSPNPCVISSHGIFVALPVLSLKVVS